MTDRELVARVLAGDPAAERALYDAHVERAYRLAFRMTGDDDLAQDVVQETFIRAFRQLGTFRGDAALATWLHSITVSVALNGLRKVRRLAQREAPMEDAAPLPATGARDADPDLRERMARAIEALPTGYRTVFLMHDVEGFTHEEIGRALGVESGTSKAQLSRARAKLRAALGVFRDEPAPDTPAAPPRPDTGRSATARHDAPTAARRMFL